MDPYDSNDDLDGDGVCNLDAYNQGLGLDASILQNYDKTFWTWGNTLGVIGLAASVAGLFSASPLIAGIGLVAGLWWLANEIVDNNSDLPDINDSPIWP